MVAPALPPLRRRIRFNGFFLNGLDNAACRPGSSWADVQSKLLPEELDVLAAALPRILFLRPDNVCSPALPREPDKGRLACKGEVGLERFPAPLKDAEAAVIGLRCRIMDCDLPLTLLVLAEDLLLTLPLPDVEADLTGVEVVILLRPLVGVVGLAGTCCGPEFLRGNLLTGL